MGNLLERIKCYLIVLLLGLFPTCLNLPQCKRMQASQLERSRVNNLYTLPLSTPHFALCSLLSLNAQCSIRTGIVRIGITMARCLLLVLLASTVLSKWCIGFSFRTRNTSSAHGRVLPLMMMHQQSSITQEDNNNKAIEDLMKQHDPILLFASKLLDVDTARDASALYAWCRRLVSFHIITVLL